MTPPQPTWAARLTAPTPADLGAAEAGLVHHLDLAAAQEQNLGCLSCGVRFVPINLSQRFCSTRCRVASHRAAQRP